MGKKVWFPVVSGPLAPYAAGFESWLRSRSYSPSAAANRLCQLDQLSRWLERNGLAAGRLTPQQAAEFVGSRREMGLVTWTSPQSVALPLEYLREIGVVPIPAPAASDGPLEELLAEYRRYLLVEQGWRSTRWSMRISRPRGCSSLARRALMGSGCSGCRRRT
jgi:integrase/recombinase XerD